MNRMKKGIIITSVIILASFNSMKAQLTEVADNIFGKGSKIMQKGLSKKIQREAITTSFSDCDTKKTLPVDFGVDKEKLWLCDQAFEKSKGYQLKPGFYKATVKSFCLKAGTYGPSKGSGYLYAPLKGPKKDLVFKLINNWKDHTDISQQQLQLLLWAIIAKTKFNNLSPDLKIVATKLLSADDMDALSKVGMDFVKDELMKKATSNLPAPAQKILEIENSMRQKFYAATVSYNEMESLAMLAGIATANSEIVDGLWSLLPNGCYVKYLPSGYTRTYVEIYVPDAIKEGTVYFDLAGTVATPAATGCQRLAQSDILLCEKDSK
jgi:hypothetical protein